MRYVLAKQLLPAFGSKPLDRISPAQIRRWFDAYSQTAPGGANHALDLLQTNHELRRRLRPHRRESRARREKKSTFRPLPASCPARRSAASTRSSTTSPARAATQQADIIRLLLLTGCRRSEIVQLRWSEVRDDVLALADSKTGPRNVPLNAGARRILERQPECGSPFVFPSPRDPARPRGLNLPLWYRVRQEAGIEDVRLHDLRHTLASHAVMNGVPVPVDIPTARPQQCTHDAALRPSRGPGNRGRGREHRPIHRSDDGRVE